jgi:hypothetical protein
MRDGFGRWKPKEIFFAPEAGSGHNPIADVGRIANPSYRFFECGFPGKKIEGKNIGTDRLNFRPQIFLP